ncbi:MAG: hypothetical protein JSU96_07220, partial [Acidobacteriota bacterium]
DGLIGVGATSFLSSVQRKERVIYYTAALNGSRENFFGPVISAEPLSLNLQVDQLDPERRGDGELGVAVQGVTAGTHRIRVELNGVSLGVLSFDNGVAVQSTFPFQQALLYEGNNVVRLSAQGGSGDISLMDEIRLSYWRLFQVDDDQLKFSLPRDESAVVGTFSSPEIRLLDVTSHDNAVEVPAEIRGGRDRSPGRSGQVNGYKIRVRSAGRDRILRAATTDQFERPGEILMDSPSRWNGQSNEADLVIISHADFMSSVDPLITLRRSQGLSSVVVDVQDIYDEFSFGHKSPRALKEFLSHTQNEWRKVPRFVLLMGDASFDPHGYLGLGQYDFVPTQLIDTYLMETASDDALVDFDNDGLAELPIGRIPARTVAQATAMVSNIIQYGSAEASNKVLLVADGRDPEYDFESATAEIRKLIPSDYTVKTIVNRDKGSGSEELIRQLLDGQWIVHYMGHGSVDLWSGDLLAAEGVKRLQNGPGWPLLIAMTCLNGYFHDPAVSSLAEQLLNSPGGVAAAWSSSGLTSASGQLSLSLQLFQDLFAPETQDATLGDLMLRAKAAIENTQVRRTWVLLGDPSMPIR